MRKESIKLVRNCIYDECANYRKDDGFCWLADRNCLQMEELKKAGIHKPRLCGHFRSFVLPMHKDVQAALDEEHGGATARTCIACGKVMAVTSPRQRYCSSCGAAHRKAVHARTMRNRRAK